MRKSKVAKFGVDLSRINNILEGDDSFKYQMLGRWQQDMDYYFGHGRRSENQLWAQDFDTLIEYMKAVWDSLEEKPEWLSMEDIEEYARHKDMPGWYHGTNGWEEKPWWAYWERGEDDGDVFKSASNIHDMMSQIRANNNSLVKSRVSITKEPYNDNEIEECMRRLKEAKKLVEDVDESVFQTATDNDLFNTLDRIQSDIDSVVNKLELMKRR